MRSRLLAAFELVLITPAALFMAALVVRSLQPVQYEPAHFAQQFVMLYAGRMWTLWILLLAMPLTALLTGGATLWRGRHALIADAELRTLKQSLGIVRGRLATFTIAATTLMAAGILAIVILHMLAD